MKKPAAIVLLVLVLTAIGGVLILPAFYTVPIMMYHSISLAEHEGERANSVSPQSFKRQMDFLKARKYRVLSMDDYVAARAAGKSLCCKSVVITFDDGLLNNYTEALPVLSANGFPATFFVGAFDVGAREGDRLNEGKFIVKEDQMSWDQLLDAAAQNITIGSHLVTESYLPDLSREDKEHEIKDSKKIIEAKIGRPVNYLAYSIGGFDDDCLRFVQEAGYKAAFTTNRGRGRLNQDLLALKRIRFKDTDDPLTLWTKLSGYYNLFRSIQNPS